MADGLFLPLALAAAAATQSPAAPPPEAAPTGLPASVCWLTATGTRHCEPGAVFAERLRVRSTDETLSGSMFREFLENSTRYEFPGPGFDSLIRAAFQAAGFTIDPRHSTGEYMQTQWRRSRGPRRLLRTWQRRTMLQALMMRDPYNPRIVRVAIASSVDDSPDGTDWERAGEELMDSAISGAVDQLNRVVVRRGGRQVPR